MCCYQPCTDENNIVISNITHINSGDEIPIPMQANVGLHSATDPSHVTLNDLPRFRVNGHVNHVEEPAVEEGSDINSMQGGDVESTMVTADNEADIAGEPVLDSMLDTPPIAIIPATASVKLEAGEPWPQLSSNGPEVSSCGPEVSSNGPEVSSDGPEVSSNGPEVSSNGPEVSSNGPEVSSNGPEVSSNGPEVSSHGPEVSSSGPELHLKGQKGKLAASKQYSCRFCSFTTKFSAGLNVHEFKKHRQLIAKRNRLEEEKLRAKKNLLDCSVCGRQFIHAGHLRRHHLKCHDVGRARDNMKMKGTQMCTRSKKLQSGPPIVATHPPQTTSVKLEAGEPWPHVRSSGPEVSSCGPEVSSCGPKVSSCGPEVSSNGPEVNSCGPKVSSCGHEVSSCGPEVSCGPKVSSCGPEVSSDGPKVSSNGPEVSSNGREVSSNGREVSNGPEVSSNGREVSSCGPEVSSNGPEVSSNGPEVSSNRPEVSSNGCELHLKGQKGNLTASKQYSCRFCSFTTTFSVGLNCHEFKKHRQLIAKGKRLEEEKLRAKKKLLDCSVCGRQFIYAGHLRSHQLKCHDVGRARDNMKMKGTQMCTRSKKLHVKAPPIVATHPPETTSVKLEAGELWRHVRSSGPEVSSCGPEVSSSGPEVSSNRPEVSSNGPEVSSNRPDVSSSGPEVSSNKPVGVSPVESAVSGTDPVESSPAPELNLTVLKGTPKGSKKNPLMRYRCCYCSFTTKFAASCRAHAMINHGRLIAKTTQDKPTSSVVKPLKYGKIDKRLLDCSLCGRQFFYAGFLRNHQEMYHGVGRDRMNRSQMCTRSKKLHVEDLPIVATHTPETTSVKLEAEEPWLQVSPNGPGVSHTEPVESSLGLELNLEVQKTYRCSYCSFTTKFYTGLRGHEVFKHGQSVAKRKKLEKSVKCGKAEKKRFGCSVCGRQFTYATCLHKHRLIYHGVGNRRGGLKFYRCTVCDYFFPKKSVVLRHISFACQTGSHGGVKARKYKVRELAARPDVTIVDMSMNDLRAPRVHKGINRYYRGGKRKKKQSTVVVITEAIEMMRDMIEAIAYVNGD